MGSKNRVGNIEFYLKHRDMHDAYLAFVPEHLRPGPATRPEPTWWPWRDTTIHVVRARRPDASARILWLHGGGGNSALLWPYAAAAFELGFEVLVPDLPGFGWTLTGGRSIRYPDWIDCITDLISEEARRDSRPLAIAGASLGGLLAYDVAARTGQAAALLVTCLLDPRSADVRAALTRWPWMGVHGPKLLHPVFDRIRVPMRLAGKMTGVANDPALNRLVASDRRGGGAWMPLGFLRTYLEWTPLVEPEQFTACLVWMVHPGADRWTPMALSMPFFERIAAPKQLVILDNCGHMPIESPGVDQLADVCRTVLDQLSGI
jgi:alpha-beta hydrolase superfamily lysophospholipase